jgi:predicted adenine nucleotide alpha hydrolase (AANH) superfamily ATPase
MSKAIVLDAKGRQLSSTSVDRARRLVERGQATLVRESPLTVQLVYAVEVPSQTKPRPEMPAGQGQSILLHVCCAPCATYCVKRLRELAFVPTGYWYNPNIHPYTEHERRRETLVTYAAQIDLPVLWEPGYEMIAFLREVVGREQFRERCRHCYRMRLERTAQIAAREGLDAFTTTLLISPYQDQEIIRTLGQAFAERYGVSFFFENFRRGWAEHGQMVREHDLYSQRYCGCVYSEWEAQDRRASTLGHYQAQT